MPRFGTWFITAKIIALLVALVVIFVVPTLAPLMIAGNIMVAVAQAACHALWLNASLGTVLALVCVAFYTLTRTSSPPVVAAFLLVYAVWNIHFNSLFGVNLYTSVLQNVLPILVVGLVAWRGSSADGPLWWFMLARALCVLVLCVHVADPTSCHRT